MLTKNRLATFAFTISIVSAGGGGCVESPEDPRAATKPDPAAGASDRASSTSDTVHRTIVRVLPDGNFQQTVEVITLAEQQAELTARAAFVDASRSGASGVDMHGGIAAALQVDTGCAGASLWLFDQPKRVGNELCLFRNQAVSADWLDLGTQTLCRPFICSTWAFAVNSLWAGADSGSLLHCTSTVCLTGPGQFLNFLPFQQVDSISFSGNLNWAYLHTP